MTRDQLGSAIRFAHAHGTVLATEAREVWPDGGDGGGGGWWLIVYTHHPDDGDGMAFRDMAALAAWLGH